LKEELLAERFEFAAPIGDAAQLDIEGHQLRVSLIIWESIP
jgi:hypothetical protein